MANKSKKQGESQTEKVRKFGSHTPLGRPAQPDECGGCYVFLASQEASYITGQVLHPNGGEIINGQASPGPRTARPTPR